LDKKNILELLKNAYHEVRLVALLILVLQYEEATKRKDTKESESIYTFYFKNRKYINNWDLVDTSVYKIFGKYLFENKKAAEIKEVLTSLSNSKNLWDRRISIVSTYAFIKKGVFSHTLDIVLILKNDKEDLNHKACGWMLREVGKKDENVLKSFLQKHKNSLPRTTLRYAIERFSEIERKQFLAK
jgi:3-methyladenine DNA glycosylase AlkD